MKYSAYLLLLCVSLVSTNLAASANTFVRETERLVALSDKTYTVIVNQYEQSFSYWTGTNRLMIRVIDIASNDVISEVVLSSTQADTSMEKPYGTTYSAVADEDQVFKNVLIEPQLLYKNLEFPRYRFHLDEQGIYMEKSGRQHVLDFSVVKSRFSKAAANLDDQFDTNPSNRLSYAMESNDVEFTGWYKSNFNDGQVFFLVLKIGRFDDDTGGLEYVFSIPNAK